MDDFNCKANNIAVYTLFLITALLSNTVVLAEESTEYRFDRLWPQLEQVQYVDHLMSMDVASDGSIYVLQSDNPHVRQFSAEGKLLQTWDETLWLNGQVPADSRNIIVAADGGIYLSNDSDEQYWSLHYLTSKGELIKSWGGRG